MPHLPELKAQARELRAKGLDWPEISRRLATPLPRTTLEKWCTDIQMPKKFSDRELQEHKSQQNALRQLSLAVADDAAMLDASPDQRQKRNLLAALYLGGLNPRTADEWLTFGHCDPSVVKIFLQLLRASYEIDERGFRVQLRCRVGHDSSDLLDFWTAALDIPRAQFFQPLRDLPENFFGHEKNASRGICLVSYLSPQIFHDLQKVAGTLSVEI